MTLNIDTTNIPAMEVSIGQCQVIALGSGNPPKNITVELPNSDGARTAARWSGIPQIAVNDYVRIQYYRDDTIPTVIVTSAATSASEAMLTNTLGLAVTANGHIITKDGAVIWAS